MEKRVAVPLEEKEYIKLKQISEREKRFVCRQAAYWIKQGIRAYEKVYGEVLVEKS